MDICEQILGLVLSPFLSSRSSSQEKRNLDFEGLFRNAQAKNSPKAINGVKSICNLPTNPYKQL